MTDWTAGYVADIGYTFGYYQELNPMRIKLAFLDAGLVYPEVGVACELGFGQGLSVNVHAAASMTSWHGTDFNPAQAGFAQELAHKSGASAQLVDQGFEDFCANDQLPEFDFIGLHGIWSWISDANRAIIVDFIQRKLKVGGVLYISYNTQPGWAAMVPMRNLLTQHSTVMGASGQGIVPRINASLDFAERLLATNPSYAKANPQVAGRIAAIKGQNKNYVAHEYFNRDWQPMSFAEMADWLAPTKLSYACSAHLSDHVDAINLTAEQQSFLADIPDAVLRQSVRDFMVNQQFRRDYWVKGARTLTAFDRSQALRQQKILLTSHRHDIALKITGNAGEIEMAAAIYNPILDLLADHQPKSLGQLEQALNQAGLGLGQIHQAVIILAGQGHIALLQDDSIVAKAKKVSDKLNLHLIEKARSNSDVSTLASPVTGGGVAVGRFQQMFLLALRHGKKSPVDMASFAWSILRSQGQKILKDGVVIESDEGNIEEFTHLSTIFFEKQLPILKALQIA